MFYILIGIFIAFSLVSSFLSRKYTDPYQKVVFLIGKPGCGKTTTIFKHILDYKKKNIKLKKKGLPLWHIYNDTPTNIPGVRLYKPNDLAHYWPDRKSVLFIDEIALLWDSRNHKNFDLKISEFFKLHRHAECVCYCASQDFDCDKRIRQICTEFVVLSKLFGCICLIRPVKIVFPVFTDGEDGSGSDIVSRYEFYKIWKWRFYYMPKYFRYFNTRDLPERPRMPYSLPVRDRDSYKCRPLYVSVFNRKIKHALAGSGSVQHLDYISVYNDTGAIL